MITQFSSLIWDFSPIFCPCSNTRNSFNSNTRIRLSGDVRACMIPGNASSNHNLNLVLCNATRSGARSFIVKRFSDELDDNGVEEFSRESIQMGGGSNFTGGFREDPIVDKLRTQLGVIHPIPAPPINRGIAGLFVFFFFVGVVFDKLWTFRKRHKKSDGGGVSGLWPQVPSSFSLFLEKDLQRKETVEWVNMVLGKLWKVYRGGLENWIVGLLQPVIDDIKKPDYVQRVEIKQFSLGDEPLSVRSVERRTSRRVNDLQFLTKLLTVDLPRLFVRPKKIVLDFRKGKAVGPVPNDFKTGEMQDGNKDFVGELSVTLVDARKLSYIFYGKTDPYVILSLGDQTIRSKKNSQTTVIGPPGEPIWNQDFHMLVANPRKQKLNIQVKDSLGFADLTIGTGEVELGSLQDTVPTDRIVFLGGGWRLFRKGPSGEILLRLTYKAYVEDEEDDSIGKESLDADASDDELSEFDSANANYDQLEGNSLNGTDKESFMDVLAALLVSEEFRGIVLSETGSPKFFANDPSGGSTLSRSRGVSAEPTPPADASRRSGGSSLFWLAIITSIAVVIAISMGGSSLFNP
ncbi:C2 domain [Dillenia turbinata]|uniref:C2 domain n=1 Tax=Dillenia turbinata TaxID=194707 RepID=A0AAN8ZEI1_9MAGN